MEKPGPEPKNRFDHNAIAVKRIDDSQLGYLGMRLAEDVHEWISEGESWEAMVTDVTGIPPYSHPTHGVNIILLRLK